MTTTRKKARTRARQSEAPASAIAERYSRSAPPRTARAAGCQRAPRRQGPRRDQDGPAAFLKLIAATTTQLGQYFAQKIGPAHAGDWHRCGAEEAESMNMEKLAHVLTKREEANAGAGANP